MTDATGNRHTSWWKKVLLILFGVMLFIVLVEMLLQGAGLVITCINKMHEEKIHNDTQSIRVLCLGESTTYQQWPVSLRKTLADSVKGKTFKIIDKGRPGTNSEIILANTERYLDECEPDVIIVMMGINDYDVACYEYENTVHMKRSRWIRSLRVYKLYNLLLLHINQLISEYTLQNISRKDESNRKRIQHIIFDDKSLSVDNSDVQKKTELSVLPSQEMRAPNLENKKIQLTYSEYCKRADELLRQGDTEGSLRILFECQKQYEHNTDIYFRLIQLLFMTNKSNIARKMYKIILKMDNSNEGAISGLINLLILEKRFNLVEKYIRERLESGANIQDDVISQKLGEIYFLKTEYEDAEKFFNSINKESLNKDGRLLRRMGLSYFLNGKYELAEGCFDSAEQLVERSADATTHNYAVLKQIAKERRIPLICMEYPMRSVEPLKRMVGEGNKVYFVSNEENFKATLKDKKYADLFVDNFGGDFGHCTKEGNQLIAENVKHVLLTEVFKKR